MRKLVAIIFIFTSFRIFVSCCKGDGFSFRWGKFKLTNLDNSGAKPVPLAGSATTINKYGVRLNFQEERVAGIPNLGFSESYAYDCVAVFPNKDTITSIDVITRLNFDNTHPPGSSVTEYMQARPTEYYQYYPAYDYGPVSQVYLFLNGDQDKSIHNNSVDLRFKNVSPNPGQYRFVFTVLFKSGRSLVDSTDIQFN
jgi:hypothetical protein